MAARRGPGLPHGSRFTICGGRIRRWEIARRWRFGARGCPARAKRLLPGKSETVVDMTLRLDNAGALSTCPQPQQQQPQAA